MPNAPRIIDANFNRSREALRVLEDVARFALDHAEASQLAKSIRHDVCQAVGRLSGGATLLAASRDTPGDVGTSISTPMEHARATLREVVIAAGRRLSEALRVIEETAKLTDSAIAQEIEQIRYRAYELEKQLVLAMGTGRARQWSLCVLITESLCTHHAWRDVATQSIQGGADCIQLREKHLDGAELIRRTRELVGLARPHDVSVIVNDRVDVALAAGAHGVHIGPHDLSIAEARAIAGDALLIGASTSTIDQAEQALREGADYCGVGAMFPTMTKQKDSIAGPALLRQYVQHDPALPPHLAIGGISPANIEQIIEAGGKGVAVSSAVCGAEAPAEVCRMMVQHCRAVASSGTGAGA